MKLLAEPPAWSVTINTISITYERGAYVDKLKHIATSRDGVK